MQLTGKTNAAAVLNDWKRLRRSYKKAVASGLNKAAYRVANEDMPHIMERGIDRPARYTKNRPAFYRKARENKLQAWVQIKDRQAEYLRPMIFGGKASKARGKAVPVKIRLNKFGNIANLKAGRKIKALLAKPDHFAATFNGVSGIFKRVGKRLDMVVYFSSGNYQYRRQFDWHKAVIRAASRQLPVVMNEVISKVIKREALRTVSR